MPRKRKKQRKRNNQKQSLVNDKTHTTASEKPKAKYPKSAQLLGGTFLLALLVFGLLTFQIQEDESADIVKSVILQSPATASTDTSRGIDILELFSHEPLRRWSWHHFLRDYQRLGNDHKSAQFLNDLFPDTIVGKNHVGSLLPKDNTVQVGILSLPINKSSYHAVNQVEDRISFHELIPDLYFDDLEMRVMTWQHPLDVQTPELFKPYFEKWNYFISYKNPFYKDVFRVHRYPDIELPLDDLSSTEKVLSEILTASLLIEAWDKAFRSCFDLFLLKMYEEDYQAAAYYATGAFSLVKTLPEIQNPEVMCDMMQIYEGFFNVKDVPLSNEVGYLVNQYFQEPPYTDPHYQTFIEKRLTFTYKVWLEIVSELSDDMPIEKLDSLSEIQNNALQSILIHSKWLFKYGTENRVPYHNPVLELFSNAKHYTDPPDTYFIYAHANRCLADQYMAHAQFQHAERLLLIAYKYMALCHTIDSLQLKELESSYQFLTAQIFESHILKEVDKIRQEPKFQQHIESKSIALKESDSGNWNKRQKREVENNVKTKLGSMFQALSIGDHDIARKYALEIANEYFTLNDSANANLFLEIGFDMKSDQESVLSILGKDPFYSWFNLNDQAATTHLLFERYHDQKSQAYLLEYMQMKRRIDSLACIILNGQKDNPEIQQSLLATTTANQLIYESLDMGKHAVEEFSDDSFLKEQIAFQQNLFQESIDRRRNFRRRTAANADTSSFQKYFHQLAQERQMRNQFGQDLDSFAQWEDHVSAMSRVEETMYSFENSGNPFDQTITSATIDSVQSSLQSDEVILIFASNQTTAYRCAIFPDTIIYYDHFATVIAHFLDLDWTTPFSVRRDLDRMLSKTDFSVTDANRLYRILFNRIEDDFVGKKLIIFPYGVFERLPFEALVCDTSDRGVPTYLLEQHSVRYIYSFQDLQNPQKDAKPLPFHAFIPYDEMDDNQLFHNERAVGDFSNYGAEVRKGMQISKTELMESLSDSGICHLATHGILHKDIPELTYLLNSSDSSERFFDIELLGFMGNTNLVYLNVCQSGTGAFQAGKGVHSLGKDFYLSGAKSVIQSPIPLDDQASAEIAEYFYAHLASGLPKSEALRQAKLSYLENSPLQRKHPYFWAGSMFYGQDGILNMPLADTVAPTSNFWIYLILFVVLGLFIGLLLRYRFS